MLVFRSLTVGLLGACLYLLANLQVLTDYADIEPPSRAPAMEVTPVPANNVVIVDVASHVPDTMIASLARLGGSERIVAVNDQLVDNELAAGIKIGEVLRRGTKLLDLTISGEGAVPKRVLVIVH